MANDVSYGTGSRSRDVGRLIRFYSTVRAYVAKHETPGCTAEDIVQETYVRAYRCLQSRDVPAKPLGYLLAIASSVVKDNWKSSQRAFRDAELLEDLSFVHDPHAEEPSTIVEKEESIERLLHCMNALPEDRRELLRDYYAREKSCKQIARELGIRHANVKVRLHRTRKKLRQLLEGGDQE